MARQNIDGTDYVGKNNADPDAGLRKVNENFTELYERSEPLAEDSRSETDPITDYPLGISAMPVSAVADWAEVGEDGSVVTDRTANGGAQRFIAESGYEYIRWWETSAWGVWVGFATLDSTVEGATRLSARQEDEFAESEGVGSFIPGLSLMPVTAGANWGPNSGQAGHVITERNGLGGRQTFHQYSNATSYERTYTASAWTSWINFATTTNLSDHIGDTSDAHDASAISILDTAAQYTATNAEDALAEILDALQAHEADTTDAHDASAISYLGSTNLAATQVEAALDELDTEKASTGSVSTVQTNLTNHIDDTSDAHDASAISYAGGTGMSATDLEAAVDELATEKSDTGHTHSGLAPTGGTTNQVLKKNSNTNYDYSWAADATGAGGSGGSGEALLNFGAFPGKTDVSLAVTGQTDIVSGSLVEAWIFPEDTVEHSADEHWVEAIKVFAGNVVAATGFTIYARTDDKQRLYGRYNVAWKWA